MTKLFLGWMLIVLVGLSACGPGMAQIRRARSAVYTCDFERVWSTLQSAVEKKSPHAAAVADSRKVVTVARWFYADGQPYRPGVAWRDPSQRHTGATQPGDGEQMFQVQDTFAVLEQRGAWQIDVTHAVWERQGGGARTSIAPDSADIPGWVQDRSDLILVEVYDQLKSCASSDSQ